MYQIMCLKMKFPADTEIKKIFLYILYMQFPWIKSVSFEQKDYFF